MKKQTRTILQELNNLNLTGDKDRLIESTANNLINMINAQYDSNTAGELERRFLNSIKNGDPRKFKRGIDKIIESKK